MKYILVGAITLLMSWSALAQVTILTDNRIELLAVNTEINPVLEKGENLKINNGLNQILVRVTAMVDGNGGKSKFVSSPIVLKFDANDQTLELKTPFPIRDQQAVRKFEKNPTLSITSKGAEFDVTKDVIIDNEFSFFKDYDKLLEKYNLTDAIAAINSHNLKENAKVVSTEKVSPSIQSQFLTMTVEEQQAFMQWAMRNLK